MNHADQTTFILFDPLVVEQPAPSPCISVCHMDAVRGLCEGCHRTIDEIVLWSNSTEAEKRTIWRAINQRRDPSSD
jgi:predicted Fe-S protein YdhL (DUF1289 family)